jgi:hypothetical protein
MMRAVRPTIEMSASPDLWAPVGRPPHLGDLTMGARRHSVQSGWVEGDPQHAVGGTVEAEARIGGDIVETHGQATFASTIVAG